MGVVIPGAGCAARNDSTSGAQVIDGSLRFNDDDTSHLVKATPFLAENQKTFTVSFWMKKCLIGNVYQYIYTTEYPSGSDYFQITSNSDNLQVYNTDASANVNVKLANLFRDPAAWYHIVLKVDTTQGGVESNRLKFYVNGVHQTNYQGSDHDFPAQDYTFAMLKNKDRLIGTADFNGAISSSCFDGYMSQFYYIDGQALGPESFGYTDPLTNTWRPKKRAAFPKRTFTNPKWYSSATLYTSVADVVASATDRGNGGVTVNNEYCYLVFNDGGYANSGGGVNSPDYSVWSDIPSFDDGSGGTITRIFYYNTSEGDNWTNAASYGSTTNEWTQWRYTNETLYDAYRIGKDYGIDNGNMLVFCANASTDTPTNAGKLSSATLPTFDTGSFNFQNSVIDTWYMGGNSFYLPMDGNTPIGKDQSGNGNDWTPVNFSGTSVDPDVLKDSPSGAVFGGPPTSGITTTSSPPSNYATWNPLDSKLPSISDGNLNTGTSEAAGWKFCRSTLAMTSGKFYWETTSPSAPNSSNGYQTGYAVSSLALDVNINANSTGYWGRQDANKYANGTNTSPWSNTSQGDILAFAYDADNEKLYHAINGSWKDSADPANGTNPNWTSVTRGGFAMGGSYGSSLNVIANFGQKPFKYAPPEGFRPLNYANLPSPGVVRPDQYVGITTWSGNGSGAARKIEQNFDFNPDLIWAKTRSGADYHNNVWDTVMGFSGGCLITDENYVQTAPGGSPSGGSVSGASAGFITWAATGSGAYSDAWYNDNTFSYINWCWKAGGSKDTFNVDDVGYASAAAAGLTAGTLTIGGASVGTKQGFSIIKYAGSGSNSLFPHGLTQTPDFYIIKCLDVGVESWRVYHKSIGATKYLTLNTNDTAVDSNIIFNDTEPTSTTASVYAGYDGVNNTGRNYIAYLWHDVPGLQKFGMYEGNDNADGPYVELGFRPAIIIVKNIDASQNWVIVDDQRDPYNVAKNTLRPNSALIGYSNNDFADFLSSGFKFRGDEGQWNAAETYIYAAWAHQPMNNLYGGQSNAR